MQTFAELVANIINGLFSALFIPFRLAQALAYPPDPADRMDAEAEDLRAEARALESTPAPERLADIARRFLGGDMTTDLSRLPTRQRIWLATAAANRIEVSTLSDAELEAQITGRARREGKPDLVREDHLRRVEQSLARQREDASYLEEEPGLAFAR